MPAKKKQQRAICIVRQSRGDDGSISPADQRQRLAEYAEREGLTIVDTFEELDVSGGRSLAKRPGLSRAVAMVEAGDADVVAVAYFDRLVRSIVVQHEVVERVERAGGMVQAVDFGRVSHETAAQWLSSGVIGMMSEYYRRSVGERTHAAKIAATMRGVPCTPRLPLGLRRDEQRRMQPDPETRGLVLEAFELRANGKSVEHIRGWLAEQGYRLSFFAVCTMLGNRKYLGELTFGDVVNPRACEPVVPLALFNRVQSTRSKRGRYSKSERLLARQDVLRCASCGVPMVVNTTTKQTASGPRAHVNYVCAHRKLDCSARASIKAEWVEEFVTEQTKQLIRDLQGRASLRSEVEAARAELDAAQLALANAVEAFDGISAAVTGAKLSKLQTAVDEADAKHERLLSASGPLRRYSVGEWSRWTLDEKRAAIRLAVERIDVAKGSGPDRLTLVPREVLA